MVSSYPGEVLSPRCFGTTGNDGSGGSIIADWKIGSDGKWWVENRTNEGQQSICGPEHSPLFFDTEVLPGLYVMEDYACASTSYVEGAGVKRADIGPPHSCTLTGWSSHVGLMHHAPTVGLRLFPVPATDMLSLEHDFFETPTYRIMDMLGQVLTSGICRVGERRSLDVSSLTNGVYLCSLSTSAGVACARFQVAR